MAELDRRCAENEKLVGKKWIERFETCNTCAGISLRDLAERLGAKYLEWYNATYRLHSSAVHATDARLYALG